MTSAVSPLPLPPGSVLADRYLLQRVAWTSPFGGVWRARDQILERTVFLQILDASVARDPDRRTAFRTAVANAAQLTHTSLLRVYDIGRHPDFVVFEATGGARLADRLAAGALAPREAARIALSLASCLEQLHSRGTWHGALSPVTVLLDEEGRPKILGAGLAGALAPDGHVPPRPYQAPEPDPSPKDVDRYALAALTHQMLTGHMPEPAAGAGRPGAGTAGRRAIPPPLDELLPRALDPDPTDRPDLDAFMAALAPLARTEPAEPRGAATAPVGGEFRWLLPAIGIVLIGVAAVLVGLRLPERFGEAPEPASAGEHPPAPISVAGVRDFDPQGTGDENPHLAGNTIDENPVTAWRTVGYLTADFGRLKTGVGLLFDLGEPVTVAEIAVASTVPGWRAEWRVADVEGSAPDDYRSVVSFTASEEITVELPEPAAGRWFLLWITRLVDDESGTEWPFRAFVNSVEFFAPQ